MACDVIRKPKKGCVLVKKVFWGGNHHGVKFCCRIGQLKTGNTTSFSNMEVMGQSPTEVLSGVTQIKSWLNRQAYFLFFPPPLPSFLSPFLLSLPLSLPPFPVSLLSFFFPSFFSFCPQNELRIQTQIFVDSTILMNPCGNFVFKVLEDFHIFDLFLAFQNWHEF